MIFNKYFLFILFAGMIYAQKSPHNIIILIGDGMDLDYVTANIFMDKDNPFVKFSSIGLSLTSSADDLITDSGAGATAISTGYRSYNHAISVDTEQKPLTTILELAKKLNKSVGVVATSSVTNATPAAFLAHVKDRKYETEIARQIYYGNADVVIGGGLSFFSSSRKGGKQDKSIDYPDSMRNKSYNFFTRFEDIRNINPNKPLFALLEKEGLLPAGKRNYNLSQLVSIALGHLEKNENGFVLMVEGSQIDWAAHDNKTCQLFNEMDDFSGAVNTALNFAEKNKNTLVIVTSDHETGGPAIKDGNLDGTDIEIEYGSTGHTGGAVGIFAKGPGEENFRGIMPNNMVGIKLFHLLDPNYDFLPTSPITK